MSENQEVDNNEVVSNIFQLSSKPSFDTIMSMLNILASPEKLKLYEETDPNVKELFNILNDSPDFNFFANLYSFILSDKIKDASTYQDLFNNSSNLFDVLFVTSGIISNLNLCEELKDAYENVVKACEEYEKMPFFTIDISEWENQNPDKDYILPPTFLKEIGTQMFHELGEGKIKIKEGESVEIKPRKDRKPRLNIYNFRAALQYYLFSNENNILSKTIPTGKQITNSLKHLTESCKGIFEIFVKTSGSVMVLHDDEEHFFPVIYYHFPDGRLVSMLSSPSDYKGKTVCESYLNSMLINDSTIFVVNTETIMKNINMKC